MERRNIEVTVVNTSKEGIMRGGWMFPPRSERTVMVSKSGYAEIKACQSLNIFEPGIRCDHPGCNFVTKNHARLKFHKRKHEKERAKLEEAVR